MSEYEKVEDCDAFSLFEKGNKIYVKRFSTSDCFTFVKIKCMPKYDFYIKKRDKGYFNETENAIFFYETEIEAFKAAKNVGFDKFIKVAETLN